VLATILFSDIVGSTARAAELGDQRWRELLEDHDRMVARQVHRFGGRLVKGTGDGALAVFDGPGRAIDAGLAMRDAAQQLGLQVRVGVHAGELERRGDDVSGIAVHIAARVQALASPDEVCVSRTVADLVAGSGFAFRDRGRHELKGVPGTWDIFAVDR
jgi:class 3 adenylate cyclase